MEKGLFCSRRSAGWERCRESVAEGRAVMSIPHRSGGQTFACRKTREESDHRRIVASAQGSSRAVPSRLSRRPCSSSGGFVVCGREKEKGPVVGSFREAPTRKESRGRTFVRWFVRFPGPIVARVEIESRAAGRPRTSPGYGRSTLSGPCATSRSRRVCSPLSLIHI